MQDRNRMKMARKKNLSKEHDVQSLLVFVVTNPVILGEIVQN